MTKRKRKQIIEREGGRRKVEEKILKGRVRKVCMYIGRGREEAAQGKETKGQGIELKRTEIGRKGRMHAGPGGWERSCDEMGKYW